MGALKLLIEVDSSPFFKKIESESDDNQIIYEENHEGHNFEYFKSSEFTLEMDPDLVKRYNDPNQNIKYGQVSIDGESYPPDRYVGRVIPQVLDIFCPSII